MAGHARTIVDVLTGAWATCNSCRCATGTSVIPSNTDLAVRLNTLFDSGALLFRKIDSRSHKWDKGKYDGNKTHGVSPLKVARIIAIAEPGENSQLCLIYTKLVFLLTTLAFITSERVCCYSHTFC